MAAFLSVVGWSGSAARGHGLDPLKWFQQDVASMASWKCILKMAQFEPSGLRQGTLDRSYLIIEGMANGGTVVIGKGAVNKDRDKGAADVDAGAGAGPIT